MDNVRAVKRGSGMLDAGWAALLSDLKERGLLDTTLVVWIGEFGRTPRITAQGGRDHWPRTFSVVLLARPTSQSSTMVFGSSTR
jgi:uncharacterized protein (DUF1501 family)